MLLLCKEKGKRKNLADLFPPKSQILSPDPVLFEKLLRMPPENASALIWAPNNHLISLLWAHNADWTAPA